MPETEEPDDRLLASYAGTATARDFTLALSGLATEKKGWAAEYFTPDAPPAGAVKLRFTKIEVKLKGYPLSLSDPSVGIYTADATPKPGTLIGAEAALSHVGLSTTSYATKTADLPAGVETTDLSGSFYVVLKGPTPTPSAYLQYQNTGTAGGTKMQWSTNGGSTWQPANPEANDVWFRVYGRYTIATP